MASVLSWVSSSPGLPTPWAGVPGASAGSAPAPRPGARAPGQVAAARSLLLAWPGSLGTSLSQTVCGRKEAGKRMQS